MPQLVAALVDILVSIDLAGDEEIDPDFAVALQGRAASAFDALTNEERHAIALIVAELAAATPAGESRRAREGFAEAYGLDDDDDE